MNIGQVLLILPSRKRHLEPGAGTLSLLSMAALVILLTMLLVEEKA